MPVNRQFLLFNFAVFLLFAGVTGTLVLVSSLNVEDGLGTSSLAVAFGSTIISAFLVPVLINRFGCRWVVFIAELGYLVFIICNVYSSYNLIIGGIFYGIGEAGVWTAYPIIASRYASHHSKTGSKKVETYRNHYIGYLFAGVQASIIFGNAAGFLILYIDRHLSHRLNITHHVNFSVCGANDCQDGNITSTTLEQYTPAYVATRYIVIAVFALFAVVAMLLHIIFLPNDKPNSNPSDQEIEIQRNSKDGTEANGTSLELNQQFTADSKLCEAALDNGNNKVSGFTHFISTIRLTTKLFFEPKHLLVVLLPLYNGLTIGYILGELTRSYASCILGLDKVAVGSMLFGVGDAVFSFISGKFAGKYGRNGPYAVAFILDIANYVFSLLWIITDENLWLVYVLFFSFGVTDGIWQTLINVMYEEYFSAQREISYNLWNVLVNIGTFVQFAISTRFCVYQKIYFQITIMSLAVITYSISQFIYHRGSSKSQQKGNSDAAATDPGTAEKERPV